MTALLASVRSEDEAFDAARAGAGAAMTAGIGAAAGLGLAAGVLRISAGNYGGKLGPYHFHLHTLAAGLDGSRA